MDLEIEERQPSSKSFPINILSWVGRHELGILFAFALIVGGIWLTFELADGVVNGNTQEADMAFLMSLREGEDADNPIGPRWVEELMRDFTALGGTGVLALIVTSVTIFYLVQGRYKEMLFLLVAVLGAWILSDFLKGWFNRPRPEFVADEAYAYSASFPSGHALLSAATYLTLGSIVAQLVTRNRLKAFVFLLAAFIMILVGFTRMYLGVHYPTDVLAGWVVGSVWAIACWLAFRWLRHREAAKALNHRPPEELTQ